MRGVTTLLSLEILNLFPAHDLQIAQTSVLELLIVMELVLTAAVDQVRHCRALKVQARSTSAGQVEGRVRGINRTYKVALAAERDGRYEGHAPKGEISRKSCLITDAIAAK